MSQPLICWRQVAYVIPDLEAALQYWTDVLKAGPFFKLDHALLDNEHCIWHIPLVDTERLTDRASR